MKSRSWRDTRSDLTSSLLCLTRECLSLRQSVDVLVNFDDGWRCWCGDRLCNRFFLVPSDEIIGFAARSFQRFSHAPMHALIQDVLISPPLSLPLLQRPYQQLSATRRGPRKLHMGQRRWRLLPHQTPQPTHPPLLRVLLGSRCHQRAL